MLTHTQEEGVWRTNPSAGESKRNQKRTICDPATETKILRVNAVGKAALLCINRPKKITYVFGINEGVQQRLFQSYLFDFAYDAATHAVGVSSTIYRQLITAFPFFVCLVACDYFFKFHRAVDKIEIQ